MLRSLHNAFGHLGLKERQALVSDRFRWPKVLRAVRPCVKTCDKCQRMKSSKSYATSLFVSQISLFDVFSVDFAGPLPRTSGKKEYFLVCAEHLTG